MDTSKFHFPPIASLRSKRIKSPTSSKDRSDLIIQKPFFPFQVLSDEESAIENNSSFLPSIVSQRRPKNSNKLNSLFVPVHWSVDSPHFFRKHESRSENKLQSIQEKKSLQSVSGSYGELPVQSGRPLIRQPSRKTVVIDLDETLIHTSPTAPDPDNIIIKLLPDGSEICLRVLIRPYARDFLKFVSHQAEAVIFTASLKPYADPIIDLLDPGSCIKKRLYRESCTLTNKGFLKDLNILKQPLSDIIIIDNLPFSFSKQQENGILIPSWFGDKSDRELLKLMKVLKRILLADDVRKTSKNFQ